MNNTTDAADPAVLLPIINGVLADCRKKDVKFVRVQLTIDYTSLVNGFLRTNSNCFLQF
jgi:hypothetical protein